MKIIIVAPASRTVFNFRGDLVKRLISLGHEVSVTCPDMDQIDKLTALGFKECIEIPYVRDNTNPFGDYQYCRRLTSLFKEKRYDLVFAYTLKASVYSCMAARKAGITRVYPMLTGLGRVFASESLKMRTIRFFLGAICKNGLKSATKVIFQNNDDLKLFVDLKYVPANKAEHIDGSGVNLTRFHPTPLPAELNFVMISRITRQKGVIEFAEAAKIVQKRYPQAKFKLVGGFGSVSGTLTPEILQPYIDCGAIESVGNVADVTPYLAEARFFVLPTYYFEGVPRAILEGMASARPILTTDWRGCRDAVIDGYNGFLVEPRSAEALAAKMLELIENPNLAETMGANSLKRCQEVYDVDIVNDKMLRIMELN
ncbi:MAG: glycosyltransferase family 4 protein [Thermoguttaceae bacterium]|nr:glycosyltransferase family 4 protein [Thermoguttaceae bacterium]